MTPARELRFDGRGVRISTPDRVLWPDSDVTKADVIDYYVRVAPVLLPHLRDRPVTLHRFPEGVTGRHFFQTRVPPHPHWVRTISMTFPRTGKTFEAPVLDDLASLVWAVNLSTIEIHPFLGCAGHLDRPTAVAFDLDPGAPAGLVDACRVALQIRAALEEVGLVGFAKTSGAKGVHVFVPVSVSTDYAATKSFARGVARRLVTGSQGQVTDRMTKALRAGKVFVDWSQNDPGKTTVAPYSLRGTLVPGVSTPVSWPEIEQAASGRVHVLAFNPDDVLARIAESGDLYAPLLELQQALPEIPVA